MELRALVIEHERAAPGGLITDWLAQRGAEFDVFAIDQDGAEPDPCDYGLIVSLGSEFAAYDDGQPWIPRELRLLRAAVESDVPVLGVCFGGQLLARALGGEVARARVPEIGWTSVGSKDEELIPDGPWFTWHFDSFALPPGARLLAHNEVGAQAYCLRRCLGVQFHPEVTPAIVGEWARLYREELSQNGVDPDDLLEETERLSDSVAAASRGLFDAYLERIARPTVRT